MQIGQPARFFAGPLFMPRRGGRAAGSRGRKLRDRPVRGAQAAGMREDLEPVERMLGLRTANFFGVEGRYRFCWVVC